MFKFHLSTPILLFTLILLSLSVYWLIAFVDIRQWKYINTTTTLEKQPSKTQPIFNLYNTTTTTTTTTKNRTVSTKQLFKFPLYPPASILINRTDFIYVINRDVCDRDNVYMLVLVGSHPQNYFMRNAIRQTLGNTTINGYSLKLIFLFGLVTDFKSQIDIMKESDIHKDIVQGNFHDSYQNMSFRDVMGLRWAWQYCKQAKYVMHIDDDVSVDVFQISKVLNTRFNKKEDFIACFMLMTNMPVLRDGRYGVSVAEYPNNTYDPYCSGWMYVLTPHMAYLMDITAMRVRPLWINDAFITGTVRAALGLPLEDLQVPATMDDKEMIVMEQQSDNLSLKYSVGYIGLNATLAYNLNKKYAKHYNDAAKETSLILLDN